MRVAPFTVADSSIHADTRVSRARDGD